MPRRILLVEDDVAFADAITELLTSEGYAVIRIANGISAINMISTNYRSLNLVICDLMLPGMRGDLLARAIRGNFPNAQLPILLLSASPDPHLDLRDVHFMSKPFNTPDLLNTIARLAAPPRGDKVATV